MDLTLKNPSVFKEINSNSADFLDFLQYKINISSQTTSWSLLGSMAPYYIQITSRLLPDYLQIASRLLPDCSYSAQEILSPGDPQPEILSQEILSQ